MSPAEADGPRGYVVAHAGQAHTVSCDLCPARACRCAEDVNRLRKKLIQRGGEVTVSTLDGVLLSTTRPIGNGVWTMPTTRGRPKRAAGTGAVIEDEEEVDEDGE